MQLISANSFMQSRCNKKAKAKDLLTAYYATHVVLHVRQENYFLHYRSTTEQNPHVSFRKLHSGDRNSARRL